MVTSGSINQADQDSLKELVEILHDNPNYSQLGFEEI